MKNKAIILWILCIGFYMFFSWVAFDEHEENMLIFWFVTPWLLPVSTSIVVYCWLMDKRGKPVWDYLKALLFSILASAVCLWGAVYVYDFVYRYLENKYAGTDIYYQYFEIREGWDMYNLTVFPIGISLGTGAMIGGGIVWIFTIVVKKVTRILKQK
jgi:hypothetical protein